MGKNRLELVRDARCEQSELARQVIDVAMALRSRGLVVGSVGNVSVRVAGGFLITPTRVPYEEMRPADLVRLPLGGTPHDRDTRASLEWPMHAAIYSGQSDAHAVVHTHSLHATAWSFLAEPLVPRLEESRYYDLERVGCSPSAPAGSSRLADAAVSALAGTRAALLGEHGVVTVGATLAQALTLAEVIEREAHVAWLLRASSPHPGAPAPGV